MRLSRVLSAAVTAAALAASAPATAQQVSWTGLYLGGHLGGAWGDLDDTKLKGFAGGLHGGYNLQNGNIVYGIEADVTWSGADASSSESTGGVGCRRIVVANFPCLGGAGSTGSERIDLDWLASLRARLGVTFGTLLIYGTGGVGWANVDLKVTDSVLGSSSSSNTHVGWVAGGGVEMKLTTNISGRIEALHYGLGSETYNVLGTSTKLDLDTTVVRGGLTYHFN